MTSPSESHGVQPTPSAAPSEHVQTVAADDHGHAAEHHAPPPFTEEDQKVFRSEDAHAGGAVVALMASIFTIGLMLYATIALIVAS